MPDSVTHSEVLYNFVKPPIHGWAFGHLRRRLPTPLGRAQLTEVYERLERWTGFWLTVRRAPGAELPYYQHGNDSGWDNATTFDPGRVVVTADLSAFLVLQLHELGALARELDRPNEASRWAGVAEEIQAALLDQLWTGEVRRALGRYREDLEQCQSPRPDAHRAGRAPARRGHQCAGRPHQGPPDPVRPGHRAAHLPHYWADGYWRGPIWAPATVLIEDGLRRAGHLRLADDISARFRTLCETHGFAENFDALTGTGLRDRAYTWTASSYLLLARDHYLRLAGTGTDDTVA
ncbi:hypothetical protein ACFQ51_45410 [Streptomyces kaempferi]